MPAVRASRRSSVAVLALTLVLSAFPLGTLASHDFADVPDSNPYHFDISALAASGVTTGCGGGNYCPSAFVTREQMAAFMNRLGALGAGKVPVVNADQLDGLDSTDLLSAGDIVTTYSGPWAEAADGSVALSFVRQVNHVQVISPGAGGASIMLDLHAPLAVGSTTYGLASVEICFNTAASVIGEYLYVYEVVQSLAAARISDNADFAPDSTCLVWNDATPTLGQGSYLLVLGLSYSGAGSVRVATTVATWTPTSTPAS